MLRALDQACAQARVAQRRPAELVVRHRTRRRVRRPPPAARCPVRAPRGVRATPAPTRTHTPPCAFRAPRACGPRARARRSHPPEPSSPRARSPPCVRPRPRTSPAARGDSRGDARSRRRPPVRPGPRRGRPGCGTRCRDAPAAGTVPAPGAGECAGARRPIRSRRRGRAGAAHMPRTRRRPASHAPSPPDTAVADRQTDRRPAGARAPSACSRPGAARRSPPAPAPSPGARRPCQARQLPAPPGAGAHAGGAHRRERADLEAARRGLPPRGRPTPRSNSHAASGHAHRGNRTLHKRDRRPARGCQCPVRPPRPVRRAVGRGYPAGCARPDSEPPRWPQ